MPKRKPLSKKANPHRLAMVLSAETGFITESKSEIARKTKLPLWVIQELAEAKALYEDTTLNLQLLEVLSYYFHDRRFLTTAIKQIEKSRRNRVIYPEDNNPVL